MALCESCQKASDNLKNSFTRMERVHLLSCVTAMAGQIHHGSGRATEQDKVVNSSVATKLLYSFEPATRDALLNVFRRTVGVSIILGDCCHRKETAVS